MRILIYGINYDPELTGIGKYTSQMAEWLAGSNHEVSMITGMPYYPEWKVNEAYRGKLWHTERKAGVRIYRSPLYVPEKINTSKRILHEFSFLLGLLPIWLFTLCQKKYDIVMYVSPPFHLGMWPYLYAKLRGAKFVTHVQDLQVDAAKDLGMIRSEGLLKWMFRIENFILKSSDAVSTISPGMLKKIEKKGISGAKISVIFNSVDTNSIFPLLKEQSLAREFELGLDDKVILYSGNIGEKQGLEYMIEASKRFRHRPDVKFVIVGSGAFKEKLLALSRQEECDNVLFFPLQPYEKLSELMALADVHLVLQKQQASDLLMPSKLSTILAAGGCPIVSAVPETSLYEIIEANRLGIVVKPECVDALCEGIETALTSDLKMFKLNARRFAENYLRTEAIMDKFEHNLIKIVRPAMSMQSELVNENNLEVSN
ncbi:WcaI family glycosyltransferase [Dyadobacter crusticola]|uniref:WcaI family glycosyltransferase n=1 Tax=Dyadobacter crusticola TaxID=292407 RepID=UPI0004E20EF4|nr:WcaI family glycosyltransferase [Dyadobacter crusticola]